ncbi:MAG: 4a-hydroxytetrahydrobiopterin dehydratase [Deltaproteobacteria bacterium]|nr:4a-hydroxytetrahydrobiopterin dehydratase [Deltaproteobacteria bacterium]
MENLTKKQCTPCRGGAPKLTGDTLREYFNQLQGWELVEDHHVTKKYKFENFKRALVFADLVGDLAERENHHPSICISWGEARIELFTHKIGGLHENDFIMASKIDATYRDISG